MLFVKYLRLKNNPFIVQFSAATLISLICFSSVFAQDSSETKTEAYKFLEIASNLKNKDKNCPKAIEVYEKSLTLKDFRLPSVYQSLASCYAQTGNREKAVFFLDKMLAVGWINDEDIRKDGGLKALLAESRGRKFLAHIEKLKSKFAKEIAPETYGVAENPAMRKIDLWSNDERISAEDFFRRVSDFNEFPLPKKTGVFVKFTNHVSDKVPAAPFYVYIPSGYDARKPHSLLVYSSGGWFQRKEFARDEAKEFVFENPVLPFVEKENFLEIFPAGNNSVGTFQFEGIENIRQILAKTKRIFNVDDNRIYLMGFSDGGVGAFRTAVFTPTDYAAFYAVNGRPFTNNHFVNMSSRPFYSLSSTNDSLFEIETTRSFFDFAKTVGADWTYREIVGQDHLYLPFLEDYLPAIFSHMKASSRQAFRPRLNWEVSFLPIGKIDWLEITEIDTKRPRADWHKIYNYQRRSSEGVETIAIGDESAAARADYHNNIFEIETSCVGKLNINLHPVMIDFSQPVKVIVNGKEVFNQMVLLDKKFMEKIFSESSDRSLVWANRISVDVEK